MIDPPVNTNPPVLDAEVVNELSGVTEPINPVTMKLPLPVVAIVSAIAPSILRTSSKSPVVLIVVAPVKVSAPE